ncbi:MAG: beta-galactosidase [Bacillota bacterium]|nr:beta-galactosidase [Bacillota bacterium]
MEKEILKIYKDKLTLGDKPFYIASGDMHYFRFFKGGWERRLRLMKDFGLTCVQTYVPWNMHEPEKGEFHFEDNLDIGAFLSLCDKIGLKVLLRPSPYMCSEWDFGGLPYWLLKDREMCIRSSDERYMQHVRSYTKRLCKEFVPYLSTNGGPIIAVAIENEYGSFGNDHEYLKQVQEILEENGVSGIPFFTANGPDMFKMDNGTLPEYWAGVDTRFVNETIKEQVNNYQNDKVHIVCEQWDGCAQQWGGVFRRQTAEEASRNYESSLKSGFMVNFYMFCGGTNFGFYNGALVGTFRADVPNAKNRYIPFTTSYDVDAAVTESGEPTEKYYEMKKVLCKHLGLEYTEEPFNHEVQAIGKVNLKEAAPFFENADDIADKKVFSNNVKCMEDLDQDFGFIMYTTFIKHQDDYERELIMEGLHDRATVYGNGQYLGEYMRDRKDEPVKFTVPLEGMTLSILVENMGRLNYGYKMAQDRKGITECVRFNILYGNGRKMHNFAMHMNWTIHTLPLRDLSKVKYSGKPKENLPGFYKGEFKAKKGIDSFVKLNGWNKGNIWINGFNLGRYWKVGPQETLYVPGELLKEHNTIEVFELYNSNDDMSVTFTEKQSLDSITTNMELILAERD